MKFSYRIFRHSDEIVLAISDSDILGKRFKEKGLQIEVSENFYHEKKCNGKEALRLIKKATVVNAVGTQIIEIMAKENLIDRQNILKVEGVPHAQIISLK